MTGMKTQDFGSYLAQAEGIKCEQREKHKHPTGAEHPQGDTLNTSGHELCARPIFHHGVKLQLTWKKGSITTI